MSQANDPEPWLRGPLPDVHPLVMPVFFSFAQVREDLDRHTAGLTFEQVWRPVGGASLGFHLKHLAGSVDRLSTYLVRRPLSAQQLTILREESLADTDLAGLLMLVRSRLASAEERLRHLDPETPYDFLPVGRRALPSTVLGLIVHLAEHTQRHLGQAITTCKVLRQT